jgi:4-amino-4-deoxy-L-arabinose transferase-like glycosyltransferase
VTARTIPGGFPAVPDDEPYTGQQAVLDEHAELKELVRRARTAPVPQAPYEGPKTGDQLDALEVLAALGEQQPSRRRPRAWLPASWPLLAVLAAQAGLSLRLIWSNTAFEDEALYLSAGHLEWAHWLHGAPLPDLATYFSGAPALYPPLGALADSIGGLAGARMLSLLFMLIATTLMHGAARRIFGRRSACFAVALFAGLASTAFLGAFATYDAMALMLLASATWLGVRATECRPGASAWLLAVAGASTALADAVKYAATLFDPVVLCVIILVAWRVLGPRAACRTAVIAVVSLAAGVAAGLFLGGSPIWQGIASTTLARASGDSPIPAVLAVSAKWVAVLLALTVAGLIGLAFSARSWPSRALCLVLGAALFLAPMDQARIHTVTSLFKHVDYGAWFAAIFAGYVLASFTRLVSRDKVKVAARIAVAVMAGAAIASMSIAESHFTSWPDSARLVAAVAPDLAQGNRAVLAEGDENSVLSYYLAADAAKHHMYATWYFSYKDPGTGKKIYYAPAAYRDAIKHGFFSVIILDYAVTSSIDSVITRAAGSAPNCALAFRIPYTALGVHRDFVAWKCSLPPRPADDARKGLRG